MSIQGCLRILQPAHNTRFSSFPTLMVPILLFKIFSVSYQSYPFAHRKRAKVENVNVKSLNSPKCTTPKKVSNDVDSDKDTLTTKTLSSNSNSHAVPYSDYLYDVSIMRSEHPSQLQKIEADQVR